MTSSLYHEYEKGKRTFLGKNIFLLFLIFFGGEQSPFCILLLHLHVLFVLKVPPITVELFSLLSVPTSKDQYSISVVNYLIFVDWIYNKIFAHICTTCPVYRKEICFICSFTAVYIFVARGQSRVLFKDVFSVSAAFP